MQLFESWLAGSETSLAVILRRIAFHPKAKVRPPNSPASQRPQTTWMTETFTQVETLALRLREVIGRKWTSAAVLLHAATWLPEQS